MRTRHIPCILICLLPFLLNSCGTVQTSSWFAFTDSLGTGSNVYPSKVLITLKGDVKVVMTKAKDPEWVPNKKLDYPYAGIVMKFRETDKTIDISASTGLSLEYRLEGKVSLMLAQKDIPAGREYRLDLSPQKDLALVHYSWKDFKQPSWVDDPTPMNLKQITGIMFTNSSKERSTARLTIRQMSFPGWVDPDSLQGKIKWLRPKEKQQGIPSPARQPL